MKAKLLEIETALVNHPEVAELVRMITSETLIVADGNQHNPSYVILSSVESDGKLLTFTKTSEGYLFTTK